MPASQVAEIVSLFVDAWNSHDMDAFGALFQDDAEFVNVYGAWWTGRSQIQKQHQLAHTTLFRASELKALEVRIKQLGSSFAHVHMRWSLSGVRGLQGPLPDRTGIMLIVAAWDREWRIAAVQNTDIVPAPT